MEYKGDCNISHSCSPWDNPEEPGDLLKNRHLLLMRKDHKSKILKN